MWKHIWPLLQRSICICWVSITMVTGLLLHGNSQLSGQCSDTVKRSSVSPFLFCLLSRFARLLLASRWAAACFVHPENSQSGIMRALMGRAPQHDTARQSFISDDWFVRVSDNNSKCFNSYFKRSSTYLAGKLFLTRGTLLLVMSILTTKKTKCHLNIQVR